MNTKRIKYSTKKNIILSIFLILKIRYDPLFHQTDPDPDQSETDPLHSEQEIKLPKSCRVSSSLISA